MTDIHKKSVTVTLTKPIVSKMVRRRREVGVPASRQVEIALSDYFIRLEGGKNE